MPYHRSFELSNQKLAESGNNKHVDRKIGRISNSNGGALCDTNCVDAPHYSYTKNLNTKEDKFSFREMAKNLLFVNEHGEDFKDMGQIKHYGNELNSNNNNKRNPSNVLQTNKSIVNNKNVVNSRYGKKRQDYKIVAITNITKKISISALLNQVHGGPVEKVEIVRNDNYQFCKEGNFYESNKPINWREVAVFLHFSKYEDAINFYQYSKTGVFRVNDTYFQTLLIPSVVNNSNNNNNNNHNQIDDIVSRLMIEEEKARRVLVFKKPVYDKRHKSTLNKRRPGYPDPTVNFSEEFNVEEIKADFGKYGNLIEILPVVSRKLCFGVQYFDVRSAIKVKHVLSTSKKEDEDDIKEVEEGRIGGVSVEETAEFDTSDDNDREFQRKYFGWYVWYGKDPCEKSVPCV